MKKVLIADSHPLFRDFLKQKLSEDQIEVITTQENRDIYTKVITSLPNLITILITVPLIISGLLSTHGYFAYV